jgi:repressor of nif and glnA expression
MEPMWYDDPFARDAMTQIGLIEVERGRWQTVDGLKELVDFDGGMVMTTRLWADRPEFDVRTIHKGDGRGVTFLNSSLQAHIEEIRRRTEELKAKGLSSIMSRVRPKS